MVDLEGLNTQQLEAVNHGRGPCLVLATAGSGKTRVLTLRAGRLVEDGYVDPTRLLLATFTRKAADEMRSRLKTFIGEQAEWAWIGTFHSHCLRILKITYHELGYPTFETLAPGQAIRLARDILGPRDAKHTYAMEWDTDPKAVLSTISRAKADLVDVDICEPYFERLGLLPIVDRTIDFWHRYEDQKRQRRLLDFDDFLLRTHQLMAKQPEVLDRWQSSFDFILEDEVQDTMIAQHAIVTALAAGHRNYFAVGDANQSIYGFRGSAPDLTVLSFQKQYPDGVIIKLPKNYRSQAEIVDAGASLIQCNPMSANYSLEPNAHRPAGDDPVVIESVDEDEEAEHAADIIRHHRSIGVKYGDIAILYRTNAQSRALEDAMVRHDIPYIVYGSCGFYSRREIMDLLAYLQLAHDANCPVGDDALKRVINVASIWFGTRNGMPKTTHFLGRAFLDELKRTAKASGCSMSQALSAGMWKPWQSDGVDDCLDIVSSVRHAGPRPVQMIQKARGIAYDAYLAREEGAADNDNEGTRSDNLDELERAADGFSNVAAFLAFVEKQQSKAKKPKKDEDCVQLLTLHRAKGLEWPIVFLSGVAHGLLPHKRSLRYLDALKRIVDPASIEEERRLCYVGITRAMDNLYVSRLLTRNGQEMPLSTFLVEAGVVDEKELLQEVS